MIYRLGSDYITDEYMNSVVSLVESLFKRHTKVLSGGILMLNGLSYAVEGRIEPFVPTIVNYFVSACTNKNLNDEMSVRMGCGLISDLASVAAMAISLEVSRLIPALSTVLADNEIQTEAKFHAIVALGDVCLASEDRFFTYLPEVMKSFSLASQVSLNVPNNEEECLTS